VIVVVVSVVVGIVCNGCNRGYGVEGGEVERSCSRS